MPYVWDGHDNATRVQETGHGFKLHRYDWSDEELGQKIETCLNDPAMRERLAATSTQMRAAGGTAAAAKWLDALIGGPA